jgi:hypothetical protein
MRDATNILSETVNEGTICVGGRLKCMSMGEKPGNKLIHNKIFTLFPSTMVL